MTFYQAYDDVFDNGGETEVRGLKVKALPDLNIIAMPGNFPYRAGGNAGIGLIEGLQFIAGTAELSAIKAAAPGAKHELFGASSFYGPRVISQIPRIIEELKENRGTRRGVLMIAHPEDNPDTIPCTLSIQYQQVFKDKPMLYTNVTMRSSDLVWGMPYDIIQFSMLSYAIAKCAGLHPGSIVINTANAHIYEETSVRPWAWVNGYFEMPVRFDNWGAWVEWARSLVYSQEPLTASQLLKMFKVDKEGEGYKGEIKEAA
jgi:hypothetical protein